MIVDDDATVRQGLKQRILRMNLPEICEEKIAMVSTVEQAAEIIKKTPPDLILLDMVLTGETGLDLLENIHSYYPIGRVLVISGHDEYRYVQQAFKYGVVDYLLKPVHQEQLMDALCSMVRDRTEEKQRASKPEAQSLLHKKALADYLADPLNRTNIVAIEPILQNAYFVPILFHAKHGIHSSIPFDKHIASLCRDLLPASLRHLIVQTDSADVLLLCMASAQEDLTQVLKSMQDTSDSLRRQLGFECVIVLGTIQSQGKMLYEAYIQCVRMLRYVKISEHNIFSVQQLSLQTADRKRVEQCLQQVHSAVAKKDDMRVRLLIDQLFSERILGDQPPDLLVEAYQRTLLMFGEQLNRLTAVKRFDRLTSSDGLREDLNAAYRLFADRQAQNEQHVIEQIVDYVREHLNQNLSMAQVANALDISYSHFSRTFKEKMGVGFSDFLFYEKMVQACKLLVSGTGVAETALKVGYQNAKSFSRAFHAHFGMTPKEYKTNQADAAYAKLRFATTATAEPEESNEQK